MQEREQLNPEELQSPALSTLPVDVTLEEETKFAVEDIEDIEDAVEINEEDLDKRNYLKISPTFYILPIKNEDENDETELFKILNPVEGTVETRELTDEEEKEILIQQLKQKKLTFNPISHPKKTIGMKYDVDVIGRNFHLTRTKITETNKTVNKFGADYKKKRNRKNKSAKASRKNNR